MLETENPNFRLIASMTEMEKSHQPWHGETGVIGKEMLARYLKDASPPIYYIAGPPGMVKGLHTMIRESDVDEGDIRAEEFSGY
jgi:Na+-transporting NADH:ubiquinone oxidoreductase subunit NqrF